jgi:formamidopyrimidine-DNA glycosylase
MPELPEVETLCRQLNTVLPGEEILRIDILDARLEHTVPDRFNKEKVSELVGRHVVGVKRHGKYIHLEMESDLTVALHLRMTGRLLYLAADTPSPSENPPYSRLVICFSSGTLLLIDPRRFATFSLLPQRIVPILTDDPMEGLSAQRLREIARTRRLPVKSFLMDQRLIAGIGNIYACEILFAAGIDPRRPACSLTTAEWRKAATATAKILRRAVDCRGTTVSDWRDLFGCSGTNQDHLEVYSRQGAPCRRCGGSIERIKLGGRGTWLCPNCQK